MQVFFIEVTEDEVNKTEEIPIVIKAAIELDSDEQAIITLNSLYGNVSSTYSTMRITGMVGNFKEIKSLRDLPGQLNVYNSPLISFFSHW